MCVAKTKALISCAVTAQLICVFVLAYSESRFSHDAAHIYRGHNHTSRKKQRTRQLTNNIKINEHAQKTINIRNFKRPLVRF